MAAAASGTYFVKFFFRFCRSRCAWMRAILLFSWTQQLWIALFTALRIGSTSSAIYYLPAPLKGILELTIDTNTPTRSVAWLIL